MLRKLLSSFSRGDVLSGSNEGIVDIFGVRDLQTDSVQVLRVAQRCFL